MYSREPHRIFRDRPNATICEESARSTKVPHNMLGRANFIWRITCAHGFFGGSYKATNPRTHFDQSFGLAMLTSIASHLLRAHNRVHTLRSSRSNPDRWRHLFHGIRRCNFFLVHDHRRQTFSSAVTAGLAMDCRVGLRWHFRCGCPISKPRPVLDFSSKNRGSFFNFCEKSKNELEGPKIMSFWQFRWKFDGSPILGICKWIYVLREYIQFVSKKFFCILINIDRHVFWGARLIFEKITAARVSKKIICCETEALQKHLRPPY